VAGLRGTKSDLERSRDADSTAAAFNNNSSLELPDPEEGESAYGSESGRASLMSTLER
jgi:hypothetical protein